jgi:hypothetical protein
MRTILCLGLGLIAIFFALMGTLMPLRLPAQAAKDRIYYKQFQTVAAFVDKNGKLPSEKTLHQLENATRGPGIWGSLGTDTPLDCDSSFKKDPTDRLVFSFWRGHWSECYAYPSGRTTLPRSVSGYLLAGMGIQIAVCWMIAIAAVWGAIRLRPKKDAIKSQISNGS